MRPTVLNSNGMHIPNLPKTLFILFESNEMAPTQTQGSMRERVRLSLAEKLDVANKLTQGIQVPLIMKEYGCCERTVRSIEKK